MVCSVSQLPHVDKTHEKWTKDVNPSSYQAASTYSLVSLRHNAHLRNHKNHTSDI